ncbi:MAG: hypothetical protein IJZ88_05560 [Clostridia bacterium]|nr:hypothetical protein [Clostridia bacterium]
MKIRITSFAFNNDCINENVVADAYIDQRDDVGIIPYKIHCQHRILQKFVGSIHELTAIRMV